MPEPPDPTAPFEAPAFTLRPLNAADAERIAAWRYPEPYAKYDLAPGDIEVLLDPGNAYYAAFDASGEFAGFCCFGPEARVPGGTYWDEGPLDVGVGLAPDRTGQGSGTALIQAALAFAVLYYDEHRFGATVAAWNQRALRAATRAGFHLTSEFTSPDGSRWLQLEADLDL